MEKEVKAKFTEQIVKAGANKFGPAVEELQYIGAWQNFIYEYHRDGESYILRFTPSSHRDENSVMGELDWILYLAGNGMSVSKPIESRNGHLTEVIAAEEVSFTVTSFVKAIGRKIGYPECLHDHHLYERLGQFTGKMHALSKTYKPKNETIQRHAWKQNYYLQSMGKYVPSDQLLIHEAHLKIINKVEKSLSRDSSSFGIIHGDINVNNFVVNDQGVTLFDFDDAQYSWFVEDIAIPLYYFVYVYGGTDGKEMRESQARRFMEHFMKGYRLENEWEHAWLKQIPLFLQLREIIVYTGMYRSSDPTKWNQWSLDYMSESKVRIENGIPIVNIWD